MWYCRRIGQLPPGWKPAPQDMIWRPVAGNSDRFAEAYALIQLLKKGFQGNHVVIPVLYQDGFTVDWEYRYFDRGKDQLPEQPVPQVPTEYYVPA